MCFSHRDIDDDQQNKGSVGGGSQQVGYATAAAAQVSFSPVPGPTTPSAALGGPTPTASPLHPTIPSFGGHSGGFPRPQHLSQSEGLEYSTYF